MTASEISGNTPSGLAVTFKLLLASFLVLGGSLRAQPIITEFMASNDATLADEDGDFSDWIEIHNPGDAAISLSGWYLTDDETEKTKWAFPAVTLAAGGYLVVFASDEDRTDPAANLHTNFRLSADGEYLGLIEPDGQTASSEFSPTYPGQTADISYGITQPTDEAEAPVWGYFPVPTPGSRNGGDDSLLILNEVEFSRTSGPFTEDFLLYLSGAEEDQKIHFVLNPPTDAGVSVGDLTTDQPLYPGPLPISDSVVIRAAIFSADGQQRGPMSTHHYMRIDNTTADRVDTFSSDLPLIVWDNHGLGPPTPEQGDKRAWLYTFWDEPGTPTQIDETPDVIGNLQMRVRGQTSSLFPKKSYRFDMFDHLDLRIKGDLTGRGGFNEWAVIGPWDYDRSYIRNAFAYRLSNTLGQWAADTRLVEAFFNWDGDALERSDYVGVYVITDQLEVEPGRLDLEELAASDNSGEALTGGYVLEIDEIADNKYHWRTDNGYPKEELSQVLIDTPKLDEITPEQIDYIKTYVQDMENALLSDRESNWRERRYLQYLDRQSWLDYHMVMTFVKNVDAFWRGAKLYKNRGERMKSGPVWDFDRSLASTDPRDNIPSEWDATEFTSQGFAVKYWDEGWWGLLAKDPDFIRAWFDRWQELRAGLLTDTYLASQIRALGDEVGAAAAARDVARWPTNASEEGSYEAEIELMVSWLLTRANWIDNKQIAPPTVVVNPDGSTTVTPLPNTELVYTLDGADPRLRGGARAPDALSSRSPVTFPAGSKFRARGFFEIDRDAPDSDWTMAVPGGIGAPYHPWPRLVNLSSRAQVQGGDNVLISGIAINNADNKWVLLRGIGPTLAEFGVTDALTDPVLRVFDASGELVAQNSGWDAGDDADTITTVSERVGAFPLATHSGDAALLINLPAGNYTVHLGSVSGASGTGLTEAYEIDDIGSLLNISVRGSVTGSTSPLIAGFVVTGDQPKRVLVRGVGPSLANFGVDSFLPNPAVRIESGGETVATNDDWQDGDSDLINAVNELVGAFNLDDASADAAVVVTLPPGVYTAVISGAGDESGLALVEVYEVE